MSSIDSPEPVILLVRDGEEPWTPEETREQREAPIGELERLGKRAAAIDSELSDLLLQGNNGAKRDPADVGLSNFGRDQKLSPAQNAREVADQARLAPHLFDEGRYRLCEVCGNPIERGRLQIFPQVTTHVACKQHEERR